MSYLNQKEVYSIKTEDWISISEQGFKFHFSGDITIKLYNNRKLSNKKLGRIAFNSGFLEYEQKYVKI